MDLRSKIWLSLVLPFSVVAYIVVPNFTFESSKKPCVSDEASSRKSITFLLGEDKPGYNYFDLAERHFLFDQSEKTDQIVKSCRSLEDMIYYLNNNPNDEKWSTIQVVLHGNPWNGLSLPIESDGPRATAKEMLRAVLKNPLPPLKTNAIDSSTNMNFWGCGIGKNPFIQIALDSMFHQEEGAPNIYCSPHFVIFKEVMNTAPKRIKASYWPFVFKRGYRPSTSLIAQEMRNQHPNVDLDWSEVIDESNELSQDGLFENSFHIPVSSVVIFPTKDSRPNFETQEDKLNWVKSQDEIMNKIHELEIPFEKFTWTVNKIIHKKKNGENVPAIKAIGMATVLCVMEEV